MISHEVQPPPFSLPLKGGENNGAVAVLNASWLNIVANQENGKVHLQQAVAAGSEQRFAMRGIIPTLISRLFHVKGRSTQTLLFGFDKNTLFKTMQYDQKTVCRQITTPQYQFAARVTPITTNKANADILRDRKKAGFRCRVLIS